VNKHTTEAFSIKYVGLDVHKETIAVAVAGTGTAEPRVLGIIPNDSDALRALVRKLGRPSELRVCYEAGPCGYVIQRFFQRLGIDCVIVAPSLIPRKPGDLASWAGMCPGNNESAGKRFSGKTRKGSKWLRTALVESAQAAARTKGTYLAAQYARIKGRHGHNKAVFAVAQSILVIAFLFSPYLTSHPRLLTGSFTTKVFRRQPHPAV
jgi:transposase